MYDSFSVVPIWMDCNCGRFFNSNSPPKSLKLHSPIWMNSSDSQFNMWNDFDSSFPQLSFFWVNELYPIFKHFNRFNSFDFECFHISKTIITDFDWFYFCESIEIYNCEINNIASPIWNTNGSSWWINCLNITIILCCFRKEMS